MITLKMDRETAVSSVAFVDMMADRGAIKGKELLEVGMMRRNLMAAVQTYDIEVKAVAMKKEALKEEKAKKEKGKGSVNLDRDPSNGDANISKRI